MIKTYVYTEPKTLVSHILTGQGGNTVRFNFEHGNPITHKLPELTLRGKYFQDLLEESELFKKGLVRKVREVAEPSDVIDEAPKTAVHNPTKTEEVKGIRTTDEVIAYVNERFDKDFRTLAKAMNCASKAGLIFPDFNE